MDISKLTIRRVSNIRNAIKVMDDVGIGIVFIVDKNDKLIGLVTDGDFRRAVLKGVDLSENVETITNSNFISVNKSDSKKTVINTFLKYKIGKLPVLHDGYITDILIREDFKLANKFFLPEKSINIPVVIMAGGKGTRMAPFTNIFPKPLIPVGKKSVLEVIMDEYRKYDLDEFYLTLNYKGGLIKAYFDDFEHDYNISYITEDKYLGTAGSLKLLNFKRKSPFFVSNCDSIVKENYLNIIDFHNKGQYDLTLIAAMVHRQLPYGVCSIKNGGELENLSEKPEFDYLVNTGMYLLNPSVVDLIPDKEFFHITHLIEKIKNNGGKVGVYPVSEKSYFDVGQWKEYERALNIIHK